MKRKSAEKVAAGIYLTIRNTINANREKREAGECTKEGEPLMINVLFRYDAARLRKESGRASIRVSFLKELKLWVEKTGEIMGTINTNNPRELLVFQPNFIATVTDKSVVPFGELPVITIAGKALSRNQTVALFYALKRVSNAEPEVNNPSLHNTIKHSRSLASCIMTNIRVKPYTKRK